MARRTLQEELDDKRIHPSYALVSFSRLSGTPRRLFGTDINHGDTICLEVHEGKAVRDETSQTDHYFDGKLLMRVEMSQMQFSELITTMNHGCGTPATFTFRCDHENPDGSRTVPPPPHDNVKERINRELKEELEEVEGLITQCSDEAKGILEQKGTIKAADKKRLSRLLERISMELRSNIPYVHKCFSRAVDRSVIDAKAELEGWLNRIHIEAGKAALAAPTVESPLLEEDNKNGNQGTEED